jgi:hypothetical protein
MRPMVVHGGTCRERAAGHILATDSPRRGGSLGYNGCNDWSLAMRRTLAVLLPVLAAVVLLFTTGAWADGPSPGACFGGNDHNEYERRDASTDGKLVQGQAPTDSDTRRAGVGLLSAAFVTSGWLFLRRPRV